MSDSAILQCQQDLSGGPAPVTMYDPMLSSLPVMSSMSSAPSSSSPTLSSAASSCSSLDTMDLDVIEYQELRPSDSLSSFLTSYDSCEEMLSDKSSRLVQKEVNSSANTAPVLAKILQTKSHKIILQERSWHRGDKKWSQHILLCIFILLKLVQYSRKLYFYNLAKIAGRCEIWNTQVFSEGFKYEASLFWSCKIIQILNSSIRSVTARYNSSFVFKWF